MFKRINIFKIIVAHFKTLRRFDSNSNSISIEDFFLFIVFPLASSITLVYYHFTLTAHITDLITAVSIIGGFLLNLLGIIYGLMDKLEVDASSDELKKVFVKELHINISFNILISIFLLIALLIFPYLPCTYLKRWQTTSYEVFITTTYFLIFVFFLTMLMILNRIYILLKKN